MSGFSFGSAPAAAPSAGGFSFGTAAPSTSSTTNQATNPTPAAGGFSFGGASTSTTTTNSAPAPASTSSGFSFGAAPVNTPIAVPADKPAITTTFGSGPTTTTNPSTTSSGGGGFGFGAQPTTDTTKSNTITLDSSKTNNNNSNTNTNTNTVTSTTNTTNVAGGSVEFPTAYDARQVSEILDEWKQQLDRDIERFEEEGSRVKSLEAELLRNANALKNVGDELEELQNYKEHLDTACSDIESDQKDLNESLNKLQASIDQLETEPSHQDNSEYDSERRKIYDMAEKLAHQLDNMDATLKNIVEEFNAQDVDSNEEAEALGLPQAPDAAVNPISQLERVLNDHYNSIEWLNTQSRELENSFSICE